MCLIGAIRGFQLLNTTLPLSLRAMPLRVYELGSEDLDLGLAPAPCRALAWSPNFSECLSSHFEMEVTAFALPEVVEDKIVLIFLSLGSQDMSSYCFSFPGHSVLPVKC